MKKNIGFTNRWIRMIIGILLLFFTFTELPYHNLGYIGFILIGTALIRFCPLQLLFSKFGSCPLRKK